jgi:hypothetical protein
MNATCIDPCAASAADNLLAGKCDYFKPTDGEIGSDAFGI